MRKVSVERLEGRTFLSAPPTGEFHDLGSGYFTSAVALAGGGFVVTRGDAAYMYADRFDAGGNPLGETPVHTRVTGNYATGKQFVQGPAVAATEDGGFLVVFAGRAQGSDEIDVYVRRFDANGGARGEEVRVNAQVADAQFDPAVAVLGDGGFVVAWKTVDLDGPAPARIYARRFNADGGARDAGDLAIASVTAGEQLYPALAAAAGTGGGFAATWAERPNGLTPGGDVYLRRYDGAAQPLGAAQRVNSMTANAARPTPATLSDGSLVVAFSAHDLDGSADPYGFRYSDVFVRRFGATGAASGAEQRVNESGEGFQEHPAIAPLPQGGFVAAFASRHTPADGFERSSILARRYTAAGAPAAAPFVVSDVARAHWEQDGVAVAAAGDGAAMFGWVDRDDQHVRARRLDVLPQGPFANPEPPPAGPALVTTIQAEDFDLGGEGVAYHDTTAGNAGNAYRTGEGVDVRATENTTGQYRLSDTAPGEWVEYAVDVREAGQYELALRLSQTDPNARVHVELDGTNLTGALAVPDTNGFGTFATVSRVVNLTPGRRVLRLAFDAAAVNGTVAGIDWLRLTPVPAPPVAVRATSDAHVRDGAYAGQTFGGDAQLVVKRSATVGNTREAYLRFPVSTFTDVSSAKLRLFARSTSGTQAVGVNLYAAGTTWSERDLTWNTRPPTGATPLGSRTVTGTAGQWYEFDVTAYVRQQRAAGATGVAFTLKGAAATDAQALVESDESTALGNRPQLAIAQPNTVAPTPQALILSADRVSAAEAGFGVVTVRLAAPPVSEVAVTITRDAGGDGNLNPASTTIYVPPAEWDVGRRVRIEAWSDLDTLDGSATFTVSSTGLASRSLVVTEADDDRVAAAPGGPAPTTLRAAADAYVRDGSYAATNYGAATQLQLKQSAAGWNRESYLRFDLSTLSTGSTINGAKLRLFGRLDNTSAASAGFAVLDSANTTWPEAGVTWNTRPAAGTTVRGSGVVTGTAGAWYEVDLTGFLRAELAAGRRVVTLVLRASASSPSTIVFDSDEAAANRPELVLT